jgi:hypothetical protein
VEFLQNPICLILSICLMIKDKKKTEEEVEDEAGDEVALSEE